MFSADGRYNRAEEKGVKHMVRTVIFDLDGTLLNTLEDLAGSTNHALSEGGFPARTLEEVRQFVGNGVGALIHRALPEGTPPARESACLAAFRAHYLENMCQKTMPYPGVLALMDRLCSNGCKVAVVSNKFDGAVKQLCDRYFGDRPSAALGERPGIAKKPAPDLVWACLNELGRSAEEAVYVGDSEVDLQTARNAGLPCYSVTWGFRDRAFLMDHGAERLVDTPEELGDLLLGQTPG